MKAWVVVRTFSDGSKEGVLFTDKEDAEGAMNGAEDGASLAVAWTDLYGGEDAELVEIEI